MRDDLLKNLFLKMMSSETGSYLFFGVLTTVVNYVSFLIALFFWGYDHVLAVNTISFLSAVIFAFLTNKIFVFGSRSWHWKIFFSEFFSFLLARCASYFFEQLGLYISAYVLHLERYVLFGIDGILISKVVLSFAVVLLNWAVSKFLIFKKRG